GGLLGGCPRPVGQRLAEGRQRLLAAVGGFGQRRRGLAADGRVRRGQRLPQERHGLLIPEPLGQGGGGRQPDRGGLVLEQAVERRHLLFPQQRRQAGGGLEAVVGVGVLLFQQQVQQGRRGPLGDRPGLGPAADHFQGVGGDELVRVPQRPGLGGAGGGAAGVEVGQRQRGGPGGHHVLAVE